MKNKDELKKKLSPLAYKVTQEKGTEPPYSGEYDKFFKDGRYECICCGEVLFESEAKFDSGCGWPAFDRAADKSKIQEEQDWTLGMHRVEVLCKNCGAHLGHVFPDGPTETGTRYCINSVCLDFKSKK